MSRVLVVGSINLDLVIRAERFPVPGETLGEGAFATFPGGKGANQAVAASRLGAEVALLGCVGGDAFGDRLLSGLAAEGVDTGSVRRAAHVASGVAMITVAGGENSIVLAPGANHALRPEDITAASRLFAWAEVVLCQLEIPLACVLAAAEQAVRHGCPFILNPAPAVPLPQRVMELSTLLTPNAHELSLLFPEADSKEALLSARAPQLLYTDGCQGVWYADSAGIIRHQPAFKVEAIDSTGAGDTFNGALAAFWDFPREDALRMAAAAAALSVTRAGAQSGMPTYAELEVFLHQAKVQS